MAKPIITADDDRVVLGTLIAVTLGILVWTCILVHGIQKDVKQIKKSLLEIEEILEPIEHINDPTGLIQHMGNRRPLQKEYPEANFHDATVPDEPKRLYIDEIPEVNDTKISTPKSTFVETLESSL